MATIIDNESKDHKITVLDDRRKTEIVLVGGPVAFLWIGRGEDCIAVVEGEPLIALAKAILAQSRRKE